MANEREIVLSFKLSKPIPTAEAGIFMSVVELREPELGDLVLIKPDWGFMETGMFLIRQCSGIADPFLKKISARDFKKLMKAFDPFLVDAEDMN